MTALEITLENAQHVVTRFLTEKHGSTQTDLLSERPADDGSFSQSRIIAHDIRDLVGALLAREDSLLKNPPRDIVDAFETQEDKTTALNRFLHELALNDMLSFSDELFGELAAHVEESFEVTPVLPSEYDRAVEIGVRFVMQRDHISRDEASTYVTEKVAAFAHRYSKRPNVDEIVLVLTHEAL